jgi:hypothetical protein
VELVEVAVVEAVPALTGCADCGRFGPWHARWCCWFGRRDPAPQAPKLTAAARRRIIASLAPQSR